MSVLTEGGVDERAFRRELVGRPVQVGSGLVALALAGARWATAGRARDGRAVFEIRAEDGVVARVFAPRARDPPWTYLVPRE